MSAEHSPLGTCPACETEIPEGMVLIEYERDGDWAVYVECPSCEVPVEPQ